MGAVAEQGLNHHDDGPEDRVFPAATLRREHPAVRPVNARRAEKNRYGRKRYPADLNTEDEKRAGAQLGEGHHIGGPSGKPVLLEKLRCSGQGEDEDLQQAVDRKSTRLNSSHIQKSRMPSSA